MNQERPVRLRRTLRSMRNHEVPEDPFNIVVPGFKRASKVKRGPAIHRGRLPRGLNLDLTYKSGADAPAAVPVAAPNPVEERPLSPSQLPGVRIIDPEMNRALQGHLHPGEFFAKSHTRYLGPFDEMPTAEDLPPNDSYVILQRMGRLPEDGKSIFRHVSTLRVP